jgi:hypothetical protein
VGVDGFIGIISCMTIQTTVNTELYHAFLLRSSDAENIIIQDEIDGS